MSAALIDPDIESLVVTERQRGAAFRLVGTEYQRVDSFFVAFQRGYIGRSLMAAALRYSWHYDALFNAGRYISTLHYLDRPHWQTVSESIVWAGAEIARARAVLTVSQVRLMDLAASSPAPLCDPLLQELRAPLERLGEHYSGSDNTQDADDFTGLNLVRHDAVIAASPEETERDEDERLAILEYHRAKAAAYVPAPVRTAHQRGGLSAPATIENEPAWTDLLPEKPSRPEDGMGATWLASQGVLKKNRDMRHLGVQAKAEVKRKARARGRKRRPRRAGNS